MDNKSIDTTNLHFVGINGFGDISILGFGKQFTRESALNLAAWIVALADRDDEFEKLLKAVRNT